MLTSNSGVSGTGANACQEGVSVTGALLAEIVFTFVFVLVVLGTTMPRRAPVILPDLPGLFWYLYIWPASVIPVLRLIRLSIGPALFQGGEALSQL